MTRQECFDFIKSHLDLKQLIFNKYGINYTNLKTSVLVDEIIMYQKNTYQNERNQVKSTHSEKEKSCGFITWIKNLFKR